MLKQGNIAAMIVKCRFFGSLRKTRINGTTQQTRLCPNSLVTEVTNPALQGQSASHFQKHFQKHFSGFIYLFRKTSPSLKPSTNKIDTTLNAISVRITLPKGRRGKKKPEGKKTGREPKQEQRWENAAKPVSSGRQWKNLLASKNLRFPPFFLPPPSY